MILYNKPIKAQGSTQLATPYNKMMAMKPPTGDYAKRVAEATKLRLAKQAAQKQQHSNANTIGTQEWSEKASGRADSYTVADMAPGTGEIADVGYTLKDLHDGNYSGAAISGVAALVPFVSAGMAKKFVRGANSSTPRGFVYKDWSDLPYEKQLDKLDEMNLAESNMPAVTSPEVLDVRKSQVERLNTPEGRRRAEVLGLDPDATADRLASTDIKYDVDNYGMALPATKWGRDNPLVLLGDQTEDKVNRYVLRHEDSHVTAGGGETYADDLLEDLQLIERGSGAGTIPSTQGAQLVAGTNEHFLNKLQDTDAAIDYWSKTGSTERYPMTAELQQYMVDNKIISNAYNDITPDIVAATRKHYVDNNSRASYPMRVLDISTPSSENNSLLSEVLNMTLGLGVVGAGYARYSNQTE